MTRLTSGVASRTSAVATVSAVLHVCKRIVWGPSERSASPSGVLRSAVAVDASCRTSRQEMTSCIPPAAGTAKGGESGVAAREDAGHRFGGRVGVGGLALRGCYEVARMLLGLRGEGPGRKSAAATGHRREPHGENYPVVSVCFGRCGR